MSHTHIGRFIGDLRSESQAVELFPQQGWVLAKLRIVPSKEFFVEVEVHVSIKAGDILRFNSMSERTEAFRVYDVITDARHHHFVLDVIPLDEETLHDVQRTAAAHLQEEFHPSEKGADNT